ncbi:MAG: hypothetical protein R6U51_01150 [Anaerolineales bacterium]
MKSLHPKAFHKARKYILEKARLLEQAEFCHRFEGGPVYDVFDALERFQNEDGGFGQTLEPDLRTPDSSALATGIGLQKLAELGCPSDHPLVRGAVVFLLAKFDQKREVWRVVPESANDHPHAPWWHEENGSLSELFDGFRIIPRALILAGLHHYAAMLPSGWLGEATESTVWYIETVEVLGEGGGSDLEYAIALAEAENLPEGMAKRLKARIREAIPEAVVRDPERWDTYCIKPLGIAPRPDALGADLLEKELQVHLDYKIAHQTPQGTWDPTWSWGESFPDTWTQARREWQGILILESLSQLKAFNRLQR